MPSKVLNNIASMIVRKLPKKTGFMLLIFPFDMPDPFADKSKKKIASYVSNANREDVLNAMKEFLIRCEHEEDWMKDI